jgi:hypothetical protein
MVRIIAYDRLKPEVTYEMLEPYLPEEVANVWRLWKAGIVRENYARADELGVVNRVRDGQCRGRKALH